MRTVLMLFVIGAVAGTAKADSNEDRAAADVLFKDGRRLVKEGKFAEACPKFEASLNLDNTAGTLLNLADCYDQLGRTATAWTRFNEAADRLRRERDDRLAYAQQRIANIEPRLAWLTLRIAEARVPGLTITRNTAIVNEAVYDTKVPVDPGRYEIVASAEGYKSFTKTVLLPPAGGTEVVEIPALEKLPDTVVEAPPQPITPQPTETASTTIPTSERRIVSGPPRRDAWNKTPLQGAGMVIMVAGGAAIATSLVFGYQAKSLWNKAEDNCEGSSCNLEGFAFTEDAKSRAKLGTVTFAIGAGLMLGGIITYAVAPKKPAKARVLPALNANGGGVVLTGSF